MDVVYTLKYSETNEELLYSIRSLCNIPHDVVYIVGGCPSGLNVKKLVHIPIPAMSSKYDTTLNNLYEISKLEDLSENFIWMNDDFFILQKISNPVKELNLCQIQMKEWVISFMKRNLRLTKYMYGVQQTSLYLNRIGIKNPVGYELHIPFIYNKSNVKTMFSLSGIGKVPNLQPRSVYGNMFLKESVESKDVKILRNSVVDFSLIDKQKFLSSSDITWPKVKPYLQRKFKNKCVYEL